jgi:hypothetical protein
MRASILRVAMFLIAAPALAHADPGSVGSAHAERSANVYAKADDVDAASSTTTMPARSAARQRSRTELWWRASLTPRARST